MKSVFITLLLLFVLSMNAQQDTLNTSERSLSKHEIGLTNSNLFLGPFSFPALSYRFHRSDKNIFHFDLAGGSNGFYSGLGLNIWNERRNYFGKKDKWFFSHGLAFGTSFSHYDYDFYNFGRENLTSYGFRLGYGVGIGYAINDRFNLQARVTPSVSRGFNLPAGNISKYNFSAPLNFSVGYRFGKKKK